MEMIVLMVGGRAQRMGRGVKSIDKTKGLLEIPAQCGTETVIDRTLRLLQKVGAIGGLRHVLMCVGYKLELVIEKYPDCKFLTTYDPDNPTEVLPAFLDVIKAYPETDSFVFILGDTVWSEAAMLNFIQLADRAPMVLYHGAEPYYFEIFGMAINGDDGRSIIRQANAVKTMPVIPEETRWKIQGITSITPKDCRISCMEQWIDKEGIPGKLRLYQTAPVDDIDWDEDHKRISMEIISGKYGPMKSL